MFLAKTESIMASSGPGKSKGYSGGRKRWQHHQLTLLNTTYSPIVTIVCHEKQVKPFLLDAG